MGYEIAYLMPTKCKICLARGAAPLQPLPGGQLPGPMQTPRSQTVLPTIQNWMTPLHVNKRAQMGEGRRAAPQSHFWWQSGEVSHSGNLKLVEPWNLWWKWCIKTENSLRNYVNFTLGNRFSWAFKTLKPISFQGAEPPGPLVPWWNLRWK